MKRPDPFLAQLREEEARRDALRDEQIRRREESGPTIGLSLTQKATVSTKPVWEPSTRSLSHTASNLNLGRGQADLTWAAMRALVGKMTHKVGILYIGTRAYALEPWNHPALPELDQHFAAGALKDAKKYALSLFEGTAFTRAPPGPENVPPLRSGTMGPVYAVHISGIWDPYAEAARAGIRRGTWDLGEYKLP